MKKPKIQFPVFVFVISVFTVFGSGCDKETDFDKEQAAIKAYIPLFLVPERLSRVGMKEFLI